MTTYERGGCVKPISPNRSDAPDPSIRVGRDRWPPSRDAPALATELALLPLAFALNAASVFVELWFRRLR